MLMDLNWYPQEAVDAQLSHADGPELVLARDSESAQMCSRSLYKTVKAESIHHAILKTLVMAPIQLNNGAIYSILTQMTNRQLHLQ